MVLTKHNLVIKMFKNGMKVLGTVSNKMGSW